MSTRTEIPDPTIAAIRERLITENQHYEFKGRVDFEDHKAKSNFIDDIVAFLNAGPGHLLIGVHEKKGAFDRFEPLRVDRDASCRQVIAIIQDNIDPMPTQVQVIPLDEADGFIIDISLPEHGLRPYQNKITGGFYLRTNAKNTPLSREQVRALFTTLPQLEADTDDLMERENAAVEAHDIMQLNSTTLHIAIVPYEYYQRGKAPLELGHSWVKTIQEYHGYQKLVFEHCENGFEARDVTSEDERATVRFFVSNEWLLHAYIAHPFSIIDYERINLAEFKTTLTRYLSEIQKFLDENDIRGPFGILLKAQNLRRNSRLKMAFPKGNVASIGRPLWTERVDNPDLIQRFYNKVKGMSYI